MKTVIYAASAKAASVDGDTLYIFARHFWLYGDYRQPTGVHFCILFSDCFDDWLASPLYEIGFLGKHDNRIESKTSLGDLIPSMYFA